MVQFKITNLQQFEAQIKSGAKRLSRKTFEALEKDALKFFKGVPKAVENSLGFQELKSNEDLRGKLGLARPALRSGGDTDANDLIKLLQNIKVSRSATGRKRKIKVGFLSLQRLEEELTHQLSVVEKGSVRAGPRTSWFRWWEFGDRGEITSLTVLRKTVSKLARKSNAASRSNLLQIIRDRSRSGAAIQLASRAPDENSTIVARNVVGQVYGRFAKIFPARMGKTLRAFVSRRGGSANSFFTRRVA